MVELNRLLANFQVLKLFAEQTEGVEWVGYRGGIEDAIMHVELVKERVNDGSKI